MQIEQWDQDLRQAVENRLDQLLKERGEMYAIRQAAAQRAGGMPVYCDIGGCIVIKPSGMVVTYDLDKEEVKDVVDARWMRAACASAAEQYPEFRKLMPRPSPSAITCGVCGGSGTTTPLLVRCGRCLGLGWLEPAD
jgi:hypothetical protein